MQHDFEIAYLQSTDLEEYKVAPKDCSRFDYLESTEIEFEPFLQSIFLSCLSLNGNRDLSFSALKP